MFGGLYFNQKEFYERLAASQTPTAIGEETSGSRWPHEEEKYHIGDEKRAFLGQMDATMTDSFHNGVRRRG
jgi:hypothetical protein